MRKGRNEFFDCGLWNTADDLGIIEDWYEFRDAEYLRIARNWLDENHLTDKKPQ